MKSTVRVHARLDAMQRSIVFSQPGIGRDHLFPTFEDAQVSNLYVNVCCLVIINKMLINRMGLLNVKSWLFIDYKKWLNQNLMQNIKEFADQ